MTEAGPRGGWSVGNLDRGNSSVIACFIYLCPAIAIQQKVLLQNSVNDG